MSKKVSTKKVSNSVKTNQLTVASGYDVDNMVFSDPILNTIPNTPISYKRIMLSTVNSDGSVGDLILETERLFSFGLSQSTTPDGKVNGYTLPLCMWGKTGATSEEKAWTDTFEAIVNKCKTYLVENRSSIGLSHDFDMSDLKKFNPMYWKRDKVSGKVVEGTGPTLYPKLIESKKNNKVLSMFFNTNDEPIDPLSVEKKYCYVKAAIKIESIFIGKDVKLQFKVYEAKVELLETGMKPLLARPQAQTQVRVQAPTSLPADFEDDSGSIADETDEPEEQRAFTKEVSKPPPKEEVKEEAKSTRKVTRVVKKA